MKTLRLSSIVAISCLMAGVSTSLASQDLVVRNKETKTYDCRGGVLTVEGGFNVLTLRNCSQLVVDGGDNTIDAGVVDVIQVAGANNKITWAESPGGRRPRITNEGKGNVIVSRRAAAGEGAVRSPAPSAVAPAAKPAPAKIRIDKDGLRESYDCRGADAIVNGDGNELTFRNCSQISLTGDHNKVQWEPAADGSRPRITDTGEGNTVSGKP